VVYAVIGGAVIGNCILHLGHSLYCRYAYYFMLPAGLVAVTLLNVLIPWSVIPPGLLRSSLEIILLAVPFLATCAQYYLVGLLLDKLVGYWGRKSNLDN
jgi:hypothetical protein